MANRWNNPLIAYKEKAPVNTEQTPQKASYVHRSNFV